MEIVNSTQIRNCKKLKNKMIKNSSTHTHQESFRYIIDVRKSRARKSYNRTFLKIFHVKWLIRHQKIVTAVAIDGQQFE